MTGIATSADVRTAGALLSNAQGGASDDQLNAALPLAQQHILGFITSADYGNIRDYAGGDTAELALQAAFKLGEARFALSFLPNVLTDSQLEATGFKTQSTIGRATTTFGNPVDVQGIADFWAQQAMLAIEDYLDLSYTDPDKEIDDPDYITGLDSGPLTMIGI